MQKEISQDVYVSAAVRQVERLHPYVFTDDFRSLPIRDQLDRQVQSLVSGYAQGDQAVVFHICSWLPGAARRPTADIMAAGLTQEDARTTMAREHGFSDWAEVEALGPRTPDLAFERAVDAVITGDLPGLEHMLDKAPGLVRARSAYGHGATLLHYLGANGVESYRQRTPFNAVEVAQFLIARGADVAAEMQVYGGGQTTLALLLSSAHPAEAGVTEAVAVVLREADQSS